MITKKIIIIKVIQFLKMSHIIEESLIEDQPTPVDLEGTKQILSQMKNCIVKIVKDNGEKGTGFFCKIPFPDENNLLNVLITNNHILRENDIKNGQTIKLIMYEKKRNIEKEIKIDNSRKKFTIKNEEGIDITILEIKQKDKINNFLEIDNEILELDCKKKSIYILHYPKDKKLVSYGVMKNILDGKEINHYCNTENGSSGSPILSLSSFKVIGVHYGGSKNKNIQINYGTFIKYAINEFYNKAKTTNEIIIKYQIGKEDKIRLFGDKFVEINKRNFEILINNNIYELNSFYKIKNEKENEILELDFVRKSIYILHYPKDKRLVSYGLMKDILGGKKISHYCNTEKGSSGSPILSLNNFKVVGVHYGGSKNIKFNFGTFIKYAIKEFNNKYKNNHKNEYNKENIANEIKIKYQIGKEEKNKNIWR